jgi:alpha-tubulin suppressor-like RCC1 family protein
MGANFHGQLGNGTTNDSAWPTKSVSSNVVAISAGVIHSLFLKSDGSLWGMGWNASGELGVGTTTNYHSPVCIVTNNVTAITAGGFHSLFLKSNGSLWSMGRNASGQLGDGTVGDRYNPVQIVTSNVVSIGAGYQNSFFVKSDGSLWVLGDNNGGQLGNGVLSFPYYITRPEQIVSNGVVAVGGGVAHAIFLKTNGSVWAMGANQYGQLGDGTTISITNRPEQILASNVVAIAAGHYHNLVLKSDGSLWGWGARSVGELGDGMPPPPYFTNKPVQTVSNNVAVIATGFGSDSLFIKSDGSLWGMGMNYLGELGIGATGPNALRFSPVPIVPDPPRPTILDWNFSGSDLTLHVTNQWAGGTYYVLMSPSVALPLSQWSPITTTASLTNGVFTLTAINAFALNVSQQFYSLQLLR